MPLATLSHPLPRTSRAYPLSTVTLHTYNQLSASDHELQQAVDTRLGYTEGQQEHAVNGHNRRTGPPRDQEMDASVVVCIRSRPGYPEQLSPADVVNGTANGTNGSDPTRTTRRQWSVSLTVNDIEPKTAVLHDPFTIQQYETIFDRYLRDSDRPRWQLILDLDEETDTTDHHSYAERHIAAYADNLWRQLDRVIKFEASGVSDCQILIVEHHDTEHTTDPGVHCLAWELLEAPAGARPRIRVTRVSDFPSRRGTAVFKVPQRLAAVRSDYTASVRVLLVVARDFSRQGAERDPEPDLAQFPLMTVQRKLRNRMVLEVVRPGSEEELEAHLALRASQGITFHLVHFDLHGRIKRDE